MLQQRAGHVRVLTCDRCTLFAGIKLLKGKQLRAASLLGPGTTYYSKSYIQL